MDFLRDLFYNGNPIYTAGQVLGLVIMVIGFFVYYCKQRNNILTVKLIADVLSVVQQAMLGAFTGSFLHLIAIAREAVFYNRLKKKWAAHPIWLWVFVLLMGSAPVFTWSGIVSILPALGSVFAVFGFYMKKPTHIRILGIFTSVFWLLYAIFTGNLGSILTNCINLLSIAIALTRDFSTYMHKRNENVESINSAV